MSFFLSDSLVGIIDETEIDGENENIGTIEIAGARYDLDSFISDGKNLRVQARGKPADAIRICKNYLGIDAVLSIGSGELSVRGAIKQAGWEQSPEGGRLIISVCS